jgi:membrane-associated phospholipid phosphatase
MAIDRPRRSRWRRATLSVLGAQLASATAKQLIRRRRPEIEGLEALISTPTGLSFPSSHATGSLAAARAFAPLVGAWAIYPPAVLMALTRIHLGVHYPSDILAGAALGTLVGSLGR